MKLRDKTWSVVCVTSCTLSVGFDFDSTKVLCKLFDKIELLIRGDSPSIFPPLNKM